MTQLTILYFVQHKKIIKKQTLSMKTIFSFLLVLFFVVQSHAQKADSFKIVSISITPKQFDSIFRNQNTKTEAELLKLQAEKFDTTLHNFSIKCKTGKTFKFIDSVYIGSFPEISFLQQKRTPKNIKIVYESHFPTEHSYTFIINTETARYEKFWGECEYNKTLNLLVVKGDVCTDCDVIPLQIWNIENNVFNMIYSEKIEPGNNGVVNYFWNNENELVFQKTNNYICKIIRIEKITKQ
jgi:hypothetical protein